MNYISDFRKYAMQKYTGFRRRIAEAYDDVSIDYVKTLKKVDDYEYNDKIIIDGNIYLNIVSSDDDWFLWGKIKVFDKSDGTEICNASYGKENIDSPMKASIDVRGDKRRSGIASNTYQWIEKLTGYKLHPDTPHSKSAQAFWGNPDRKFGH